LQSLPKEEGSKPKKVIIVSGEEAFRVAQVLTATTLRMLQLLWQESLDVSTIARRLDLSEAYISEQVKLLEELKLITVTFTRGKRGIRKVSSSAIGKIILAIR
jgi:predicted transcriptional regulator